MPAPSLPVPPAVQPPADRAVAAAPASSAGISANVAAGRSRAPATCWTACTATVLAEVARRPLPGVAEVEAALTAPVALDVEWFYTARELCVAIEAVADLPLTGITPGPAAPRNWMRIAYKGGSEPGVLNLTTAVQARDGWRICVAATWNHPPMVSDGGRLQDVVSGALTLLR